MKQRYKIIHIIQSLDSGGCENMLLRTLPLFDADFAHEIIVLKERGELAPQFEAHGISVSVAPAKGKALAAWMREQQPAAIMTYLVHADVFGRFFLQDAGVPVIPFLRTTHNFWRYWPARVFEKWTHKRVKRYFANSDAVKKYYVERIGVDPARITVIPNGIDMAVLAQKSEQAEKELPITADSLVVSCVANLAPNKGHASLVAAFDQVAADFPRALLLLAGEGVERPKLEAQIAASSLRERMHLLGRRGDVAHILSKTAIFVLPTLFEGMSMAILEAMASGCACITTDIPENKVLVTDQKTGLLVPPSDTAALAQALRQLLSDADKRAALGRAAQSFIEDNFDLKQRVRQWEDELKKEMEPTHA